MTNKKNVFLEKTVREIKDAKLRRMIWEDISFRSLAKESDYSYKQFMKMVRFTQKHNLANFSASIDYQRIRIFTAMMFVSLKKQGDARKFKKRIDSLGFIQNIYFIGQTKVTFVLRIRALNFYKLKEYISDVREKAKDLIQFTNTSIVFKTFLEEGKKFDVNDIPKRVLIDEKDIEIIRMLQINAHFPLSTISEAVKLREPTVHRRIKKMKENKIITGYHFIRNWSTIPSKYWPVSAFCVIHDSVDFDCNKILELPSVKNGSVHIRYIYTTCGINHIQFSFSTRNMMRFRKFIFDEIVNIPGIIHIKPYPILEGTNRVVKYNNTQ